MKRNASPTLLFAPACLGLFLACSAASAGEAKVATAEAEKADGYIDASGATTSSFLAGKEEAKAPAGAKTLAFWKNGFFMVSRRRPLRLYDARGKSADARGCADAVAEAGGLLWVLDAGAKTLEGYACVDAAGAEAVPEPRRKMGLSLAKPVAAAGGDDLFVLDAGSGTIVRFREGRAEGSLPAPSASTADLAFDGTSLWAADPKREAVYLLDGEGRVLVTGRPGFPPTGIAASGGRIFLLDGEGGRIVRFDVDRSCRFTLSTKRTATIRGRVEGFGTTYLALPVHLNRQRVLGPVRLHPPATVVRDRWGQRTAKFPAEVMFSTIEFRAEMYRIRYHVFPEAVGPMESVPEAVRRAYTVDGEMLDLDHPFVAGAAAEVLAEAARKPERQKAYWIARLAYAYTIRHVPYKRGASWVSAPKALKRGFATCSPIAFTFVAVCRAAGLPARFAAGTKYRGADPSTDREFHRWPEAYLPGYGWIPVDASLPTYKDPDPAPWKVARSFGFLPDNTLILMVGGGGSDIFGWGYNGVGRRVGFEWSEVEKEGR